MMTNKTVLVDRDQEVLIVTINRPEVRNAVDIPTSEVLLSVFQEYDEDDGASVAVKVLTLRMCWAGAAILLSSEELEELLALSDRIVVMYEGEIVGDLALADMHEIGGMMTEIGLMMTGGKKVNSNL